MNKNYNLHAFYAKAKDNVWNRSPKDNTWSATPVALLSIIVNWTENWSERKQGSSPKGGKVL